MSVAVEWFGVMHWWNVTASVHPRCATLCTTKLTWTSLALKSGLLGDRPTTWVTARHTERSRWGRRSSGIWRCVVGWKIPDIWKGCCAFIFRVKRSCSAWPWLWNTTIFLNTWCCSPKDTASHLVYWILCVACLLWEGFNGKNIDCFVLQACL